MKEIPKERDRQKRRRIRKASDKSKYQPEGRQTRLNISHRHKENRGNVGASVSNGKNRKMSVYDGRSCISLRLTAGSTYFYNMSN